MLFVGADGMECADPENPDDRAKDVRLFQIQVYEVARFALNVPDRLFDVQRL